MLKRCFLCVLLIVMVGMLAACRENGILLVDGDVTTEVDMPVDGSGSTDEGSLRTSEESTSVILVHICGEVTAPGVYELAADSRVYQLIELAGGFTPDAAKGYLNLADRLYDGQKVVVPTISEVENDRYDVEDSFQETGGYTADSGLVNINTADKAGLMTLPGIGETKALAIIAWRTEHGKFQTTEDIMQVSGIKEAAYEKIRTLITVD